MRQSMRWLAALAILTVPLCLTGCGGSTPMPGASSASSEESDASGGLNKDEGTAAGEAKSATDGQPPAVESKPAEEPKAEGKSEDKSEGKSDGKSGS